MEKCIASFIYWSLHITFLFILDLKIMHQIYNACMKWEVMTPQAMWRTCAPFVLQMEIQPFTSAKIVASLADIFVESVTKTTADLRAIITLREYLQHNITTKLINHIFLFEGLNFEPTLVKRKRFLCPFITLSLVFMIMLLSMFFFYCIVYVFDCGPCVYLIINTLLLFYFHNKIL